MSDTSTICAAGASEAGNGVIGVINQVLGALGLLKKSEAEAFAAAANAASMGSRGDMLLNLQKEEKQLKKNIELANHYGGVATDAGKKQIKTWTDALSNNQKQQKELVGVIDDTTKATKEGTDAFEDYGEEGEGIIHECHCENCGARITYRVPNDMAT